MRADATDEDIPIMMCGAGSVMRNHPRRRPGAAT